MQERVWLAEEDINRHEKEVETFLNRIVAIDETLLRSFEPELKSKSTDWHNPASTRPAKFRRKHGNLKQLAIFAYDKKQFTLTPPTPPPPPAPKPRWFTLLTVLRRWSRYKSYSLLLCGLFYEPFCFMFYLVSFCSCVLQSF